MISSALFSPCRRYRYTLHRVWDSRRPLCAFIGLNPSTADETKNDPTVTRCIGFAGTWGFGGLIMLNLFGFRSTDPKGLSSVEDPVGPDNDRYIVGACEQAGRIVCAWGCFPEHKARQAQVLDMLRPMHTLHHLGLTKQGWPRHPLFLRKDVEPQEWRTEQGQHGA